MTVKCKVSACPWNTKNGFCDKGFCFINPMGKCGWLYDDNGRVKQNWREKGIEREKSNMGDNNSLLTNSDSGGSNPG